jgi:plastocyanin
MFRKIAALSLALAAGILVACGGGHGLSPNAGTGGTSFALPPMGDLAIDANLPKHTIGENLPSTLGTIKIRSGAVGGFTQTHWSQMLAFPPGTKITIHNLSKNTVHTFDVVKEIFKPTVRFPKNPALSEAKRGGDKLLVGYASGPINPGHSVTVVLAKEGVYMVGCFFHYSIGMRDVIVVKKGAKPGPQATPPGGGGNPGPSPTSSGGGGGWDTVH